MKVTEGTRMRLARLREKRALEASGFHCISDLSPLRVGLYAHRRVITECRIGPDRRSVWIKTEDPAACEAAQEEG